MPDAIALPGIDQPAAPAPEPAQVAAPAAPAATPVTPGTDATPIDNARDPESPEARPPARREDAGDPDDAAGDGERRRPRRDRGPNGRISELVEQNRRTEALLERTLEVLARQAGGSPQQQREALAANANADPEPTEEQYTSWAEYTRAVARWEGRQETRREIARERAATAKAHEERTQQTQVRHVEAAVNAMQQDLGTKMHEAVARFPDYHEVVGESSYNVPVPLQGVIASSDDPGGVAYYLAKHEDVARQLAAVHPVRAATVVARIAHAMKSGNVVSNAPAPGRPAGARGAAPGAYPENATVEQHLEWEKRQGLSR